MPKFGKSITSRDGRPMLRAELALKTALKKGGETECGAYKKMIAIWEKQIEKAIEGSTESAKLIIERLDGKPKQQIDQNVSVNVAFEQVLMQGRQRAIEQSPYQTLPEPTEEVLHDNVIRNEIDVLPATEYPESL